MPDDSVERTAELNRWRIADAAAPSIVWDINEEARLPHSDHIEMSGRRVSVIATYAVDEGRRLSLTRRIVWPTLRLRPKDVRGYLIREYGDELLPHIEVDGRHVASSPLRAISIDRGRLVAVYTAAPFVSVIRSLFPSPRSAAIIQTWTVVNGSGEPIDVAMEPFDDSEEVSATGERYIVERHVIGKRRVRLSPGQNVPYSLVFTATRAGEGPIAIDPIQEEAGRIDLAHRLSISPEHLHLETPDPVINAAFAFAKLRAAESVFETAMGAVHSPGGGRYYAGIWANDQAEYSGPLFAFLNDADSTEAALNAYLLLGQQMKPDYSPIPSSIEVEGEVLWRGAGDRGDAAMIASGGARFALTHGHRRVAQQMWPIVSWCLEFCRRRTNAAGIVESDSDELEGRHPAGTANLATSCLTYDGLRRGADLARALYKRSEADEYDRRADSLGGAIDRNFGAFLDIYPTYRYYDGNTTLRSWICLPLVFDLAQGRRLHGTIAALFSPKLWTEDGLAVEAGSDSFWDRSTLYALRGVFRAGATEEAYSHLMAFTRRRLLGDHVPYAIEAWPEGGQAHLSAESALYCRIFVEGLFGITPTGLHSFTLAPRLPRDWPFISLQMTAFGHPLQVHVTREEGDSLRVTVLADGETVLDAGGPAGTVYKATVG